MNHIGLDSFKNLKPLEEIKKEKRQPNQFKQVYHIGGDQFNHKI